MKIVCVTLLVSTVMVIHAASPARARCTPGQIWREDCNTCLCTKNGNAFCTRMACNPKVTTQTSTECSPGTRWKEDCNTCVCTDNGLKACTLMACPPTRSECAPGASWQEDCNTCICNADGRASCTEKACLVKRGFPY